MDMPALNKLQGGVLVFSISCSYLEEVSASLPGMAVPRCSHVDSWETSVFTGGTWCTLRFQIAGVLAHL